MKTYKADLHIHTCLSPCAELEMSPRNIVREAKKYGLDIIGVCDHNSCENVAYVIKSAANLGLSVIAGMEVCSREEVHILALFNNEEELFTMQDLVYLNLHGTNNERLYGEQVVVNENDQVLDFNKRLLIGATELSIERIVSSIHELHGIAIASHVDRQSFSLISQLGFVPEDLHIDALEVSTRDKIECFKHISIPKVTFSDAHRLDDLGRGSTDFSMQAPNLEEIRKTFLGFGGREVIV